MLGMAPVRGSAVAASARPAHEAPVHISPAALERAGGQATTGPSSEVKTWSQTSGKEPSPGKTGADHAESGRLPSKSTLDGARCMRADLR